MRYWTTAATACALALGSSDPSLQPCTQTNSSTTERGREEEATTASLIYNPYPPGILPPDLDSELARVLGEVDGIEQEALAQLSALPPPVLTGQPPTLQGTGKRLIQLLGKAMNFDKNISPNRNLACSSCHMPYAGFSGPIPSVNLTMVAYPGTAHFRAGKRSAQISVFPFFPVPITTKPRASFWRQFLGFTRDRYYPAARR
jgi:hypothetical protein